MPEAAPDQTARVDTRPKQAADRSPSGPAPGRWRRWGVRLTMGYAVAWLLFVAAHRVLSGRVWWWILPDLTPPVAFLVVPVFLLVVAPLLRPTRRWVVLLALAALVLGWPVSGVHPTALWHRPGPVPAGAITVFAWNTHYWDRLTDEPTSAKDEPTSAKDEPSPRGDGPLPQGDAVPAPVDTAAPSGPHGRSAHDPDLLYRYLRAQRADVYLLQEYLYFNAAWEPFPIDDSERLRREFPGYHIAVAGELLTLSRFPIVGERALDVRPWLSRPQADVPPANTAMPDYYTLKTLRTDLRIAGRVVSVYNTHLILPVTGTTALDPRQRHEARAAQDRRRASYLALSADVAANPHPVVLAGDLNTSPAMSLIRTLPDRLVDAVGSMGRVYPVSWSWHGVPLWRLDWVFTTADVAVHRYRMVPAGALSDHHGQHVTLSL